MTGLVIEEGRGGVRHRPWTPVRVSLWAVVVGLGVVWAWRRLRQTYFHFDEWSMIELNLDLDPLEGAIRSFNGHLYLFQDALYRTQAVVFGLESNELVVAAFITSLIARHLVIAALAMRLGANDLSALLVGGLLTYPGVASETFLFPWQVSPSFAAASALAVAVVVIDRTPTSRRVVAAGALLLVSVLLDSGLGILALVFGGGVLVSCWPRRTWWALAPGATVLAMWLLTADRGPQFPGSIGDRSEFFVRLIVRSAGGLVGGGAVAGVIVLSVAAACIFASWRMGLLRGPRLAVTVTALLATAATAAAITQSRAAIPGFTFFNFNRYLHNVGLPLAIAIMPAAIATCRWAGTRWMSTWAPAGRAAVVAVVLVGAWAASLDEENAYGDVLIGWNRSVESAVQSTAASIEAGCPAGTRLDPAAQPAGSESPQITVDLVARLLDRGLVATGDPGAGPDPEIVARICVAG